MASRSLCRGMSYSVVCFTEDCDDALFSEYFFLMDANSLQNCASFVTRQKQFRTVFFFATDSESVVTSLCFFLDKQF